MKNWPMTIIPPPNRSSLPGFKSIAIFLLEELMDELISEKDDFDRERQKKRKDLDPKEEQLVTAGNYIRDLAMERVKRVAEVVH